MNIARFASDGLIRKAGSQRAPLTLAKIVSKPFSSLLFLAFSVILFGVFYLESNLSDLLVSYIPFPQSNPSGSIGSFSSTPNNSFESSHSNAAFFLPYPVGNGAVDKGIHSSLVCGTWQSEYRKLHNEIVAENKKSGKGKFLIFSSCKPGFACGGVGDHLLGMSSIFLLSIIHKRAFLVEWPELESTKAFFPSTFDWRIENVNPSNSNIVVTDINCGISVDSSEAFEINALNFEVGGGEARLSECIGKLHNASTIRVHINRGISYWAVTQPTNSDVGKAMAQMGMKPSFIAGCLLRNLVMTSEKVISSIAAPLKVLHDTDKLKVCIHARRRYDRDTEFVGGAVNMDAYLEETKVLLSCANTLFEFWGQASVGTIWYFMAGSEDLKKRVRELHPDKILVSGVPVMHTDLHGNRSGALATTIAEWHLYTQCHFFVFHSSGMSKTAATFAMRPFSMYSFGNNQWSKLRNQCSPGEPSTPTELGTDWSGL